jgi:Peptidase propeptide and YPEB domain
MRMSKNDINQNRIKYEVSKNILFGIIVGIISAGIGITGISNISAQEMAGTTNATNATSEMQDKVNWTGTIDVKSTIAEAFKSKVTVNIIDAINAAQTNVGANSFVKEAELTDAHGYLVYKITAVDENMKKYKVIVDPGNGQVLMKKEVTGYEHDEHDKMKYGEDKYDKYGHDDGYDKKKMMMMKDKKY